MFSFLRTPLYILGGGAVLAVLAFVAPGVSKTSYVNKAPVDVPTATASETKKVSHISTPEPIKAIYMTSCVAGVPSWRSSLKELIDNTELNTVVIDIKDATGIISFEDEALQTNDIAGLSGCKVKDLGDFIAKLHDAGIYVIGRISVFQDPYYSQLHPELAVKSESTGKVWRDRKGLSFIDVGATPYWDYIVNIAKASYNLGFDELNFDYVRYPSDGNIQDTYYSWMNASSTKAETLEGFFKYLHKNLSDVDAKTSADLFGMVTTVRDDMGIGQVLERALPYFDFIDPMVYPSHYPATWNGYQNPADHPYEVVKAAMSSGMERERAFNISRGNYTVDSTGATTTPPSKLRPWLQDFDLGADYTSEMVRDQMQASYDIGLSSWLLWNAGNEYTRAALLPESSGLTSQ